MRREIEEGMISASRAIHEKTKLDPYFQGMRLKVEWQIEAGMEDLDEGFRSMSTESVRRGIQHFKLADKTARTLGVATIEDVENHRRVRPFTKRITPR